MLLTPMMCLAFNVYHEARGTSATEQAKVINVIVNRSNKRKVNYCTTTFEKGQFSWTSSFKPKYEFKDYDSMLKYYHIDDTKSLSLVMANINNTMFERYMGNDGNGIDYYHDNRIKQFSWNKNGKYARLVYATKDFKFYRTV